MNRSEESFDLFAFRRTTSAKSPEASPVTDRPIFSRCAGDAKICKTNSGFAVAVKDAMTTTMLRLAYAGSLECVMIDFNTMEEIVQQKETA